MKRIILSLFVLTASAIAVPAQKVTDLELKRQGDWMMVKMKLETKEALPGSNETVLLTPELRNGRHSQTLKPVGLYSRNQWYYYRRSGVSASGTEEFSFRRSQVPAVLKYETMVPYRSWMDGAKLYMNRDSKGCCGNEKQEHQENYLAWFQDTSVADTVYRDRTVIVEKESAVRSLAGRAFVDFPLNSTQIDPNYHSNATELGYLRASIDSVRNYEHAKIRKIWIKGYASPEGPYDNNVRLAESRTKAIRDYVASLYAIPEDIFEIEFEPENWEGFRSFVEASSLQHRADILAIMDMDREPDDREWMMKARYPADWKILLNECLPFLRRTDYRIEYEIINNQ